MRNSKQIGVELPCNGEVLELTIGATLQPRLKHGFGSVQAEEPDCGSTTQLPQGIQECAYFIAAEGVHDNGRGESKPDEVAGYTCRHLKQVLVLLLVGPPHGVDHLAQGIYFDFGPALKMLGETLGKVRFPDPGGTPDYDYVEWLPHYLNRST